MKDNKLKAVIRKEKGKGAARSLRRQGMVPAVLYGYQTENVALAVKEVDLLKLLHDPHRRRMLLELEVEGNGHSTKKVLIKEVQHDIEKLTPIHVDFLAFDEKRKMVLGVHITYCGEPVGVKNGGILRHHLDEIKIECLPYDIPENITVDVSNLDVGDAIYLEDIQAGTGYTFVSDEKLLVASVEHPVVEEELEVEEEVEEEAVVSAEEALGKETEKPEE